MQKVYQAFHCGSETCQLCYDRSRSQHAAPSLILNDFMCASRSTTPKQVLANMFFSATRLSSALPCTCSNCKVSSQISSTCYSGIWAQLQSSKQNLELDHVPLSEIRSTLNVSSIGESPLTSLDSISKTKSGEPQSARSESAPRSHMSRYHSRSPAGPRTASAQLDPIGRKAKKIETRNRSALPSPFVYRFSCTNLFLNIVF